MDGFLVVTYPAPVRLHAKRIEHDSVPQGHIALGYFSGDHLVARGVVPPSALEPLYDLLNEPIKLAIAVAEDAERNIEGRVCVVLPVAEERANPRENAEPWRRSVPDVPAGIESGESNAETQSRLVLLPLGQVVRSAANRKHEQLADDARDMLDTLVSGKAEDAVSRAIDDLLRSI
jgi:hypothetical protein